jgi:hypothetical protein
VHDVTPAMAGPVGTLIVGHPGSFGDSLPVGRTNVSATSRTIDGGSAKGVGVRLDLTFSYKVGREFVSAPAAPYSEWTSATAMGVYPQLRRSLDEAGVLDPSMRPFLPRNLDDGSLGVVVIGGEGAHGTFKNTAPSLDFPSITIEGRRNVSFDGIEADAPLDPPMDVLGMPGGAVSVDYEIAVDGAFMSGCGHNGRNSEALTDAKTRQEVPPQEDSALAVAVAEGVNALSTDPARRALLVLSIQEAYARMMPPKSSLAVAAPPPHLQSCSALGRSGATITSRAALAVAFALACWRTWMQGRWSFTGMARWWKALLCSCHSRVLLLLVPARPRRCADCSIRWPRRAGRATLYRSSLLHRPLSPRPPLHLQVLVLVRPPGPIVREERRRQGGCSCRQLERHPPL